MSENKSKKRFQQIVIFASSFALLGMIIFPLVQALNRQPVSNNSNTPLADNNNNSAQNEQLTKIAQGYEAVLQREPENRVALQGLVEARASMNDFAGAKEPMQKLVELDPENPVYLQTLAQINLQLNDIDGALVPLEKLAKIYPERTEIDTIIDTLKKAQKGELPQQQPSPSASPLPVEPTTPDPSPSINPDSSILTPPDPSLSIPLPSPQP